MKFKGQIVNDGIDFKVERFHNKEHAIEILERRLKTHENVITNLIRKRENEPRINKKREIQRTLDIVKRLYKLTLMELKGIRNGSIQVKLY